MFLAADDLTINSSLVITVLVIIALLLGISYLWRHR